MMTCCTSSTMTIARRFVSASMIVPSFNSDTNTFSNITMIIYIEQVKTYYKNNFGSRNTNNAKFKYNDFEVNIGMSYIDCLTGSNGVMSINNSSASDISIPFDELLKLLTIKNPNELIIYVQDAKDAQDSPFSDDELINALSLIHI